LIQADRRQPVARQPIGVEGRGRFYEHLGQAGDHGVSQAGPFAFDPKILAENPPADIELSRISDLLNCDLAALLKKQ
jgi:hypothetical protein